jgi:type 1 fimbriae regulatory protein FimB
MTTRQSTLKFLTQTELKALLIEAKKRSTREHAMVLIGYRHALRCSEVCNITMANIDLDAANIRCERGKGSISNWQQLAEDEVKALRAWLRKRPKSDSKFMFVSRKGSPVSRSQFFRLFKDIAQSIGLSDEKCHPHILKHSLGTHLANAGVPPQVIQQRLGHRNIQNTMIYLSVSSAYTDRMFEGALNAGAVV